MKITLLLIFAGLLGIGGHSQELIFKINQSGISYKNNSTNKYDDAQLKSSDIIITLDDKTVKVLDENTDTYSLEKMNGQNNNIKHLYTQIWKGKDQKNQPIQFRFTVNIETKEAMVEVGNNDYKSYYFGKYAYGNVDDPLSKQNNATISLN